MGIQISKLDNETISKLLISNYNIIPVKIEKINRGTANIFRIETKAQKYILKEFCDGRTKESVIKEANIIEFLNKRNIKVPIYVKSIEEKIYLEYKERIIILQEFIDGYTMENNTGDYEQVLESASVLGKLTKALKDYSDLDEEGIIQKWFSKESLEKGIVKIKELQKNLNNDNIYKEKISTDLEIKIKISEKIIKEFDFNILEKLTITNAHGDYSVQQLIYNGSEEPAVIDFETAKRLPIVWEVIRSYSYIDKDAKDGELNIDTLVEYFKEFTKYIELNEYDLKYAPYIYLIQIVSSTFGYKQYNNDYTQEQLLQFAFFRTSLCKFLYENLETISDKLIEE